MLVVAVAEAVSLGTVKPPAEADIVADGGNRVFGLAPRLWAGPLCGRDCFAGEVCAADGLGGFTGETTDSEGAAGICC